jgi:DNA transposition AAA+ family ATPase
MRPHVLPVTAPLLPEQAAAQDAFYNVRIFHPKLLRVMHQLDPLLSTANESTINVVVGATGVGKTTFSKALVQKLWASYASLADADPTCIPIVTVEAYATGEVRHGFRELFLDILEQLKTPMSRNANAIDWEDGRISLRPQARSTIASLRRRVEAALRHRQVRVLVIDEAYHLCRFGKESSVLDTLKSLANTAGVKLVLIGSYDLHELVESHSQVARRTSVIHFERYVVGVAEDHKSWKRIVKGLQDKWPCKQVPDFEKASDALLDACLGCVGLLKALMLEASAMQLRNGGVWDNSFLPRAAKASGLREVIRKEIEVGEQRVRDSVQGNCMWDEKTLTRLSQAVGAGHA